MQLTNMSAKDRQAAIYMIERENARRAKLEPPQAALPIGTNAEIKTGYEMVFVNIAQAAHASYITQEAAANGPDKPEWKAAFLAATPALRTAALATLQG